MDIFRYSLQSMAAVNNNVQSFFLLLSPTPPAVRSRSPSSSEAPRSSDLKQIKEKTFLTL